MTTRKPARFFSGAARSLRERVHSARYRPMRRFAQRFNEHQVLDRAATLTYYALLSLVPGAMVLLGLVGVIGPGREAVDGVLDIIKDVGPEGGSEAAREPVKDVAESQVQGGALLGVGLITVLWTASAYVGAFIRASETIWGVERRAVWRNWPLRVALTVTVVILLALSLVVIVLTGELAQAVGDALGIASGLVTLWEIAKWPVLLLVMMAIVVLLYRASPNVRRAGRGGWRAVTIGGAVAVLVWALVSAGFDAYLALFGSYESVYGTLGNFVATLIWLWLSNIVLLFGAEIDAELERSHAVKGDTAHEG